MKRSAGISVLVNVVGLTAAGIMFFPIFWTFLTGLKSEREALAIPPIFWFRPSLEKYIYAFQNGEFLSFFINSIIIVLSSAVASLLLTLPAAYALAFFPGKRARDVQFFTLSTRFTPGVAIIVPIYIVYVKLGLIDTRLGLILIYIAMDIPIVLWLMGRFFREIPRGLLEAAMLDGASHVRTLCSVVLPLSLPGMVTTSFLIVIMSWNEFFFAVNLVGRSAATLPVFMASFFTTMGQTWAQMSAAATLSILPILILGWKASGRLAQELSGTPLH